MTRTSDETHNPSRRSWVTSANGHPDFPIQNLPFGRFRPRGTQERPRLGIAIGDEVLDLARGVEAGMLREAEAGRTEPLIEACRAESLNSLMAFPPEHRLTLRRSLSRLLAAGSDGEPNNSRGRRHLLLPM
ncbi:MAG TPA: hypothetical protein VFM14_00990, partial [Gemmatimonadales bacterium]|nr:hypothetical protein [Gemmatimonadales bacterium]